MNLISITVVVDNNESISAIVCVTDLLVQQIGRQEWLGLIGS